MYDDRATFYMALSEFVEDGENTRFQSDLVFNDDGTILVRHDSHADTDKCMLGQPIDSKHEREERCTYCIQREPSCVEASSRLRTANKRLALLFRHLGIGINKSSRLTPATSKPVRCSFFSIGPLLLSFPSFAPQPRRDAITCVCRVQVSRTDLYLVDLTDTTKNVDALEGSRDVVGESSLDPKPFAYSGVSKLSVLRGFVSSRGSWIGN